MWMDTDGVLRNVELNFRPELKSLRLKALAQLPGDMNQPTKLRMVSLSRLQEAIAACQKAGTPLPDEIRYLAGLQRVQYVFVVPELHDIVLAGPAEGWTINNVGDVVGRNNGQPVLQLDDLLVALRSADAARSGGISCSINPRPEGVKAFQAIRQAHPRRRRSASHDARNRTSAWARSKSPSPACPNRAGLPMCWSRPIIK